MVEKVRVTLTVPKSDLHDLMEVINEQDTVAESLKDTIEELFYIEESYAGNTIDRRGNVKIEKFEFFEEDGTEWEKRC